MTQAIDDYKKKAQSLFNDNILGLWKTSDNVWRNGCAMDTILDYFTVCEVDPSPHADTALNSLNPMKKGNWWDDFGWIGLAALRAAELNPWPNYRDRFLKIAINSWAYMWGPGWSDSNTDIYPFTGDDLPGWEKFKESHTTNRGAPNVWNDIEKTWNDKTHPLTQDEKMKRRARYDGGIWNSPIENSIQPELTSDYKGDGAYVNPIQNTVTNAVFTLLSLRSYLASQNPVFSNVFTASRVNTDVCLVAWKLQIEWFEQWIVKTTAADESMMFELDTGCLIRERASTFHEWNGKAYWDGSYRKEWIWTGDQGLLIGLLRESEASELTKLDMFYLYPQIIEGVFAYGYQPRTYNNKTITGNFLLPWIVVGSRAPNTEGALAGDANDYQTGTHVFMRYLLQAFKAHPSLLKRHKDAILNSANNIIKDGFGTDPDPQGSCDSYTPYTWEDAATQMSAYVNRLSVLLLAIELSK